MKSATGFTLVELLVVITIIVVLLALLTPALDKAIYQAELSGCAARLDGIATGVTGYASGNARAYPYRETLDPVRSSLRRPSLIRHNPTDDRSTLRLALGGLKIFNDPLSAPIDADQDPTYIHVSYNLWFGMWYPLSIGGGKGMRRLGDRLEWVDRGQRHAFRVLASDQDWLVPFYTNGYVLPAYQHVITSHPDKTAVLYRQEIHSAEWEVGWWTHSETHERGALDLNFVMTDGAVERWENVTWDDERMARVPEDVSGNNWNAGAGSWIHLPPQH